MTRLLTLAALLLLAAPAHAQVAADYYHQAAGLYIGGDRGAAEHAAERGLQLAPDDPKLQALLDRIRQDQQQSGQGDRQNQQPNPDQQSSQQGQEGSEGEPQQGENQQGEEQDEGRPEDEEEGAASDQPEPQQPRPEQGDPSQPGREGEEQDTDAARPGEGEATPESATPVPPGEMTRAEAERILNAVGADERLLLQRVQRQEGAGRRVEKDW